MAKCTKCGKKGLFLHVNSDGLCKNCATNALKNPSAPSSSHVEDTFGANIVDLLKSGNILRLFNLTEEETAELADATKSDYASLINTNHHPADLFMAVAERLIFSEQEYNPVLAYKYLLTISFFPQMNIVRLHYAELRLIERLYKLRETISNALNMCETLCIDNINNIPMFLSEINKPTGYLPAVDSIPSIPSIKRLAIIYENQGRISNAITISQIGHYFNPSERHDNRIMRLLRKPITEDNSVDDLGLIYTYEDIKDCKDKTQTLRYLGDVLCKRAHTYTKTCATPSDYTVIDAETTGLNYNNDEIIELGAIKYRNFMEVERFQTLINPQIHIPESATAINHITDAMVKNQPCIADKLPDFLNFIGNDVLVGHNVGFDIRFILHACYNLNLQKPFITALDTLPLARKYIPKTSVPNYSLDELRTLLNIKTTGHRAIADCEATNTLYEYCHTQAAVNKE